MDALSPGPQLSWAGGPCGSRGSLGVSVGSELCGERLVAAGPICDAGKGKGTSACPAGLPVSSKADGRCGAADTWKCEAGASA